MELNKATLSDFTKLADIIFTEGMKSVDPRMRNSGIFKTVTIPEGTGSSREFTEIDLEEYAEIKDESDQATRANVQQGYSKTMYQYRVALDIGISYEMRTQNKYPEVIAKLTNLGRTVVNRQDLDMAHRIGFAASTTYTNRRGESVSITVGDGYQLAYTAHTVRGASTTFRNILANNPRLSKGALEAMERLVVEETINQFGEKMADMNFDILWTTDDPNTVNTAKEYLQSTADPDAAHSGVINPYISKYRHVILPRVATTATGAKDTDKRYYWGLASSQGSTAYLGIWEETRLLSPDELGKDTSEDWNYGARGGYGLVIVSAPWFKMSKGDSSA